jgi:predicted RNA-binding Zn-ribbon protein involved in translation (DUF1610 family)
MSVLRTLSRIELKSRGREVAEKPSGILGRKVNTVRVDTKGMSEEVTGRPCPLCEEGMVRRHCKYVCPRHGVVYDCADTFW